MRSSASLCSIAVVAFLAIGSCNVRVLGANPVVIIVEANRQVLARQRLDAAERFNCRESLLPFQLAEGKSAYQIRNPEGFAARTGLVYLSDDSGQLTVARFWTVSGREVFELFVESLLAARGEGVQVEGDESRKSIRTDSVRQQGKVRIKWNDLFVCFEDNVVFIGDSPSILTITRSDSQHLNAVVHRSDEVDWLFWAGPGRVDPRSRVQFMSALAQQLGVYLQRRDGEADESFRTRVIRLNGYLESIRSALFDVEDLTASIQFPDEDEGLQFRFVLKTRPGSPLGRALEASPLQSRLDIPDPGTTIGALRICAKLPSTYRPAVIDLVSGWIPDLGLPARFTDTIASQEEIDLVSKLGISEDRQPIILGGLTLNETNSANSVRVASVERNGSSVFSSLDRVSMDSAGSHLLFSVSNSTPVAHFKSADAPALPSASNSLVDLNLDFGKFRDWDNREAAQRTVGEIEQMHRKYVQRMVKMKDLPGDYLAAEKSKFGSLSDQLATGGDWTVRLRIAISGEDLLASAVVGRDAYQYHMIRRLIEDAALLQ